MSAGEPSSLVCEDGFVDAFWGASVQRTDRARVNEAAMRLHPSGFDPWRGGLHAAWNWIVCCSS